MATAGELVTQILNQINVRQSEAPIQADEAQDTIFMLNSYMLAQSANGINLGYTQVSDLGDEITVPDGAILGIVANVAILMASTFDVQVSQSLVAQAKIGLDAMRKIGVSMSQAEYPSELPIGSGNEGDSVYTDHLYQDRQTTILQESGGSIGLESNTDV